MSSFGAEKASHLSFQLNALLASSPSPRSSSPPPRLDAAVVEKSKTEDSEQENAIKNALAKLDLSNAKKPASAAKLIGSLAPLTTDAAATTSIDDANETLKWALVSQVTLGTYSVVLSSLIHNASQISLELEYWRDIGSGGSYSAGSYLFQTLPHRIGRIGTAYWSRWRDLTAKRESEGTWQKAKQAWLPPSLLLTSAFPHLVSASSATKAHSSRSAFFLTLSPLLLARQEASLRLRELEALRDEEANRVGQVAEGIWELEEAIRKVQARSTNKDSVAEEDVEHEKQALASLIERMQNALSPGANSSDVSEPSSPLNLAAGLRKILIATLPNHSSSLTLSVVPLQRPPWLVRTWPALVFAPLTLLALTRLAWSYRDALLRTLRDARETVKGFFIGWVAKPLEDIVETLRAGEKGTLAIMSDESLHSDLASLERMVGDFGRERYHWTDEQVLAAASKVREGDLTEVLKAWEQEIKTPLRSAVGGSLVRALLIQVQKLKVDVAVAMDGIQKMLRSQQLTFAAIGVAPSMLVCWVLAKLGSGTVASRGQIGSKGREATRREVRTVMRRVDRSLMLLSTPDQHHASTSTLAASLQKHPHLPTGLLLLDLSYLRRFAHSSAFPLYTSSSALKRGGRQAIRQAREEFLEDVRDLEDFGLGWESKRRIVERMWRCWGGALGLQMVG